MVRRRRTRHGRGLGVFPLVVGLVCGGVGCTSVPGTGAAGVEGESVENADALGPSVADSASRASRDMEAIRGMAGVFEVVISVSGAGSSSVSAREAVMVEPGAESGPGSGSWVMEHLLLVGEPAALARHWSSVWTPVGDGRWRVTESEADGRPGSRAVGRWVHEAWPGSGETLVEGVAGVSRFVPEAGSVRAVTTRSPGLSGLDGDWWASTVVRVGPGAGWTRTTEGQLLGADGRPRGGAVTRTEAYVPADEGEAAWLEAEAWWSARREFWGAVRAWWDAREGVEVVDAVDGVPMWRAVLDLESAVRRGEAVADGAALDAVLGGYVVE